MVLVEEVVDVVVVLVVVVVVVWVVVVFVVKVDVVVLLVVLVIVEVVVVVVVEVEVVEVEGVASSVVAIDVKVVVCNGKVNAITAAGIVVNPIDINSEFASSIVSSAIWTISIISLISSSFSCIYKDAVELAFSASASVSAFRSSFS